MEKDYIRVFGISRHRFAVDGKGVTTLVALSGCPLSCKYCINATQLKKKELVKSYGIKELIHELSIDLCYFVYTGGGITFGGGEPLLQSKMLLAFLRKCPPEWNITIETSLNVDPEQVKPLFQENISWIVDIKSRNKDYYRSYTGLDNDYVTQNLIQLQKMVPPNCYEIKVPEIPGFCKREAGEASVKSSVEELISLGFAKENVKTISYICNN